MKRKLSESYKRNKAYVEKMKAKGWVRRTFFGPKQLINKLSKIWSPMYRTYKDNKLK